MTFIVKSDFYFCTLIWWFTPYRFYFLTFMLC